MSDGPRVSPISGTAPPVHGQWKPGQSGNPEGGRIRKKWLLAIEEAHKRSDKERNAQESRIKASVAMIARAHNGDVAAYKELADREDGKVTTPIESVNVTRIVSGWDE